MLNAEDLSLTQGGRSERFWGPEEAYLNEMTLNIPAYGNPEADQSWIERRRGNCHKVLPFSGEPYDLLAINVPSTYEQGAIPTREEPPIGMLRVVASAREAEYNAGSLDAHSLNLSLESIAKQIGLARPKLVGLNPTSVNIPEGKAVAELCDILGIPYVLGGISATLDPMLARRNFPNAFAVIRGDGELAIRHTLGRLAGVNDFGEQPGIFFKDTDTQGIIFPPYAEKMPIEQIPMIRQEEMVQFPVVKQDLNINGNTVSVIEGSLYTTRGCPFECGFCASPVMVGRGQKGLRPYDHPGMDRVVDEVEAMMGIGANAIHFLDDMVITLPRDIDVFHAKIEERGLKGKFLWRGMTRAPVIARESFNEETAEKLTESGCWRLTLGVESGDDVILRMINKQITTSEVETAVRKLVGAGIQVKAFFIMGFPGETWEQIQRTRNFVLHLKNLGLASISLFMFKPYPGTGLWEKLLQENPEPLKRLDYIGGDARNIVSGNRGVQGVYLPDDVQIADVPSGRVRELIETTLEEFYSS